MEQKGGTQGIFLDMVELQNKIQDIGDVQQAAQTAQTLFEQLPADIKQKYGNDLTAFFKDQKKIYEENQKKIAEENQKKIAEENQKKEVTTNETK